MTKLTLQRGLAITITLGLLLIVFELVRRKRLSERYAILWLVAATTLFVLAAWKGLLTSLSNDVGIAYPPSALFAVAIGLIAIILLHFSLAVSRLSDQNKILAQRLALLQQRVDENDGTSDQSGEAGLERAQIADTAEGQHAKRAPRPSIVAEELSRSR